MIPLFFEVYLLLPRMSSLPKRCGCAWREVRYIIFINIAMMDEIGGPHEVKLSEKIRKQLEKTFSYRPGVLSPASIDYMPAPVDLWSPVEDEMYRYMCTAHLPRFKNTRYDNHNTNMIILIMIMILMILNDVHFTLVLCDNIVRLMYVHCYCVVLSFVFEQQHHLHHGHLIYLVL
jgi:hypothetical protein